MDSRTVSNEGKELGQVPATNRVTVQSEDALQQEFHNACRSGQSDIVERLLPASEISINSTALGSTALYEAVKFRHFGVVRLLLNHGADINVKNSHDLAPLHRACLDKQTEMVKLLLEFDCDINSLSSSTGSASHIASMYKSDAILDLLLRKGADLNLTDKYGRTPLHVICTVTSPRIKSEEAVVLDVALIIVQKLVDGGADVNLPDTSGQTPLHICTQRGLSDIVRILSEKADLNSRNNDGETSLYQASKLGFSDIVHHLLEEGADYDLRTPKGDAPIHVAAEQNRKTVVDLLVQYGADVAGKNGKGQTALHCVCANNCDVTIMDGLLLSGGAVDVASLPDRDGNRPIHVCAKYNHTRQLEKLLQRSADCIDSQDGQGRTAVFVACQQGHRETVRLLLGKGADLSVTNARGRSPLHQICEAGFVYVDLVGTLLNHEPNLVKLTDTEGKTALHVACQAKLFNDRAVSLLVTASHRVDSDTNRTDNTNSTAFASMLRSCQSLLPFLSADEGDSAMKRRLESLEVLSDAGGRVDDLEDSILTSSSSELNNFLIRSVSPETRPITTPLIERLMQSPENMRVLADCGHRLDTGALSSIRESDFVELMTPPSLMIQSRGVIRRVLRQRRGSLREGVGQLPLPSRIHNYINFDY